VLALQRELALLLPCYYLTSNFPYAISFRGRKEVVLKLGQQEERIK
jgi:hypothetical protein